MFSHLLHLASRHLEFYWSYSRCISEFKLGLLLSHEKTWVEWDEKPHSRFGLSLQLGWAAARGYVTL